MIIGITGFKGSGKTTAALALRDRMGFEVHSFAGPLKAMVEVFMERLGLSETERRFARENKEAVIWPIGVSYRWVCQSLGTEWGREHVHPDVWIMAAEAATTGCAHAVFDDVRFENEADLIRRRGGLVLHLARPGLARDGHASEDGVAFVMGRDLLIENAGDADRLRHVVVETVLDWCANG